MARSEEVGTVASVVEVAMARARAVRAVSPEVVMEVIVVMARSEVVRTVASVAEVAMARARAVRAVSAVSVTAIVAVMMVTVSVVVTVG